MRNLCVLDAYRDCRQDIVDCFGSIGDHETGVFNIPSSIDKQVMRVIASRGEGWEHVSVSRFNRCPNWPEMSQIYGLFFRDNETAMQLHVPAVDHINCHPHCLHLWRPIGVEIPRPPSIMVGPTTEKAS